MSYQGDIKEDQPFNFDFTSRQFSTGAPFTLGGTPVLSVYKDNNIVETTTGPTLIVDFDGKTGNNNVAMVTTDAFYVTGSDYSVVITTGTVDGVSVVGEVVATFSIENRFNEVDVTKISGDAAAADNLEAMFDGTGYTGVGAPSSREQVDGLGAAAGGSVHIQATEDNTGGAIIDGVVFVGSVQDATTFSNTEAEDGIFHDIDDTANDIDIVYGFSIGGNRTAVDIVFAGFVQGNGDEMKIKVFDHVGSDWEIIGTIPGQNGTINVIRDLPLLLKHTGTGSELGKVYIRFDTDSTTPSNLSVDQLLVSAVNIGQSVGYANGQIWVDTVGGVAGVEPFVNGVADKKALLWTDAVILSGLSGINITDFHINNGSTITLSGTSDNFSLFGDNWILQLASRSVAGAYFQGAAVSGIGTSSSEVHFEGCDVSTASIQLGHFDFCSFDGTITHTLAGDYNYHNCYSKVAGVGSPIFTKTAGQAVTVQFRNWAGSITVSGIEAGDVMTISGTELGDIVLNGAEGTVKVLGIYESLTDNRTGSPTLVLGAYEGSNVTLAGAYAGSRGPGVFLNDAAANTGTVNGIDGTWANPVSTIAAAKTIADSIGVDRIYLVNDSTITLVATMEDYEFIGIGEMSVNTVILGSQDVDHSHFINLVLTGAQGGTTRMQATGCVLSLITGMEITALECLIANAGSLTLRNDCAFDSCFSAVAGGSTPTLDINGVANVNVYFRHYSGGLQVDNAVATTVMSYESDGQLIIDATCTDLTIVVRGNCSITDNGTTTSLTQDAAINLTNIKAEILTNAMAQDYAANGVEPNMIQAIYAIHQMLMDFIITGTSNTVRKLNNSDTAFIVTLDDASDPTEAGRV